MRKNAEYFIKAFGKQMAENKRLGHTNIPYGSNVMPILRMYKDLSEYDERREFEDALEAFLTSGEEEKRRFAITICLGFLIFRDAI
ncbi:MAG: hypothetical protein Q8L64_02725 [bacterium]|nr:hypothetical protein [bacterium]